MALRKGLRFEDRARRYLQSRGLGLLEKNFRSRFGEIDLIMTEGDTLCFIEVKYRRSTGYGGAATSIPRSKRRKLIKTALFYLACNRQLGQRPARFDWIKNAFYAE